MASKQLGKLRQWGRDVISSKEKTVLTEEFKEIERDVDLRKVGIERLHGACSEYHGYLQKKKEYSSVETGVKMLPVDALGAVMMSHGEQFGDDSAFGQCLLKFGRAHSKIATLQETYALTFRNTYLDSLEDALEELSDYATQRKKLDSRRLAYDAAVTRVSKAKKEKEVQEAHEELHKAKLRYEETSTDIQARMQAIQDNEIQQLRDLTDFLTTETCFVEQYLDVLRDTRDEWIDKSSIQPTGTPRRKASPHAFSFGRSTPSISTMSKASVSARSSASSPATVTTPSDGDDGDHFEFSAKHRASPAIPSRPSSRGSSTSGGTTLNHRRRYSTVASDGVNPGKRMRVASWASNAVSSLSGSGRNKQDGKRDKSQGKSRETDDGRGFANLDNAGDSEGDDDDGVRRDDDANVDHASRSVSSSKLSRLLGETQPMSMPQFSHPPNSSSPASSFNSHSGSGSSVTPLASRKIMRALFDFSGSSDELSFRTGDEIVVVREGKGGWSMGELWGRRALFPVDYTEEVTATRSRIPPPHLPTSPPMTSIAKRAQIDISSEDGASIVSEDLQDVGSTVRLFNEPFGDHHLLKAPLADEHEHEQDLLGEITLGDEDEMQGLFGQRAQVLQPDGRPSIPQQLGDQTSEIGNALGSAAVRQPPALPQRRQPTKKPPPPVPARRPTVSNNAPLSHSFNRSRPSPSTRSSSANANPYAASFPQPPMASKRSRSRTRSPDRVSASVSPFDT